MIETSESARRLLIEGTSSDQPLDPVHDTNPRMNAAGDGELARH
jgi:hypothetical protein